MAKVAKGKKPAPAKKAHGRPRKYNQAFDELAYRMCLLGATDKEIANFLGVVESTINKWKIDHPSFSESVTRGKEKADMVVAGALYDGAQDKVVYDQIAIKCKRVDYDEKTGKKIREVEHVEVVDVAKTIPADFRNQQFWLKNRKSTAWRDKHEIDHTTAGERINLANVPTDTLKTLIDAIGQSNPDS